jgi:hypothetical protein
VEEVSRSLAAEPPAADVRPSSTPD